MEVKQCENHRRFEDMRSDGLQGAVDRWIQNEMWNHDERGRPADLHDAFAFVRGFNEGIRFMRAMGGEEINGKTNYEKVFD